MSVTRAIPIPEETPLARTYTAKAYAAQSPTSGMAAESALPASCGFRERLELAGGQETPRFSLLLYWWIFRKQRHRPAEFIGRRNPVRPLAIP